MRPYRELSFVARFMLLSAVMLTAVGLLLGQVLSVLVKQRATERTAAYGDSLVHLMIEPSLDGTELEGPLDGRIARRLDEGIEAFAMRSHQPGPLRYKVFNAEGEVVHSDLPDIIGRSYQTEDIARALEGEVVTAYTTLETADEQHETEFAEALEVYVPMKLGTHEVQGVAEVYLPWAPVAAEIRHDRAWMQLALAFGLLLFYLAMYRLVRRTSRSLQESAEHNAFLAHHDTLTGLPNRALLLERLERAIVSARRHATEVGLLLIDLDGFKEVNDTLGHETGDELLCQIGDRLVEEVRDEDTVARLGGDEFVVLLPQVDGVAGAAAVAARILDALHRPMEVRGIELAVEASIGIACYPDHGEDQGALLQHADVAMYAAKESRGSYAVYDQGNDESSLARITVLHELRRALEDDELALHYQPKEELRDGSVRSVEALVRWHHPERGVVSPAEFIPLAEQTGLMAALTDRVLTLAMGQLRTWQREGLELAVSVNLSARNLLDLDFPRRVAAMAEREGVDLRLLEMEVTETSAMADPVRAAGVLQGLADLGVEVSIDDFGTGYSSLAYLRSLPINTLKIDRSFVGRMHVEENDAVIVRSTIELAHNLGLRVVAEGVEDERTRDELRALGCDMVQGFVLAPPVPPDGLHLILGTRTVVG